MLLTVDSMKGTEAESPALEGLCTLTHPSTLLHLSLSEVYCGNQALAE